MLLVSGGIYIFIPSYCPDISSGYTVYDRICVFKIKKKNVKAELLAIELIVACMTLCSLQ